MVHHIFLLICLENVNINKFSCFCMLRIGFRSINFCWSDFKYEDKIEVLVFYLAYLPIDMLERIFLCCSCTLQITLPLFFLFFISLFSWLLPFYPSFYQGILKHQGINLHGNRIIFQDNPYKMNRLHIPLISLRFCGNCVTEVGPFTIITLFLSNTFRHVWIYTYKHF